jgi:hypothetical protein
MGRTAERIKILNARPPLPAAFVEIEEQLAFFLPPDADSDGR